jgi:hypothetical protein
VSKISFGNVAAGGILAGLVLSGLDFVTDNYILASDWQNTARLRNIDLTLMAGTGALVTMIVVDFLLGQVLVLTYAAIRPRFGPGPGTAAIASFLVFFPEALVLATFGGVIISWDLFVRQAALTLVATLAGGVAGAWIYTEKELGPSPS